MSPPNSNASNRHSATPSPDGQIRPLEFLTGNQAIDQGPRAVRPVSRPRPFYIVTTAARWGHWRGRDCCQQTTHVLRRRRSASRSCTTGIVATFIATSVQEWLDNVGVKTLCIAPGSPWENGYSEWFNGSLRAIAVSQPLVGTSLVRASALVTSRQKSTNAVQSRSSLVVKPIPDS